MKLSIKRFLLIYLLLTITILSTLMMVGNYLLDNHAIRKHFDDHLEQTTFFFNAIITANPDTVCFKRLQATLSGISALPITDNNKQLTTPSFHSSYAKFKIWNNKGQVLLLAKGTPDYLINKNLPDGFNTIKGNDRSWRVLVTHSTSNPNISILVAEEYDLHSELVDQLAWNNLLMLLWSYPLFALLIWLSIDRGLHSLRRITDDIVRRQADRLDIVDASNAPLEIKPLVDALNRLFRRLHETFERNKRFSGDAAHELRTPLAALKTQAQVALKVSTEEERKAGLRNVILGVDRCTHIVQQLLTLSRLDPEAGLQDLQRFNIANLAAEMVAQLVPNALEKNIDIELIKENDEMYFYGNETFIAILIRNLVDNAIRYTPENGEVKIELTQHHNQTIIKVTDSGPGIPKELRTRVFERFYRVLGTKASGSGLGLAIVQQIAQLHNGHISLSTPRSNKGLEISVTFPDTLYSSSGM